jgi:membrane-associated protein
LASPGDGLSSEAEGAILVGALGHSAPVYATIALMPGTASTTEVHSADTRGRRRKIRRATAIGVAVALALLVALAVVLHLIDRGNGFSWITGDHPTGAYLAITLLIIGDAIVPILPGETTVNAGATLAAQGTLSLGGVIVASAVGAIAGDSSLYWIARRWSPRIQPQVARAKQNKNVVAALDFMGDAAALVIIAGRFVPGMRFVVNATMGVSHYPYRRFLLYTAIGGSLWALYTGLLAYAVATALADFPLASIIISGLITTTALAVIFVVVRRRRREPRLEASVPQPRPGGVGPVDRP